MKSRKPPSLPTHSARMRHMYEGKRWMLSGTTGRRSSGVMGSQRQSTPRAAEMAMTTTKKAWMATGSACDEGAAAWLYAKPTWASGMVSARRPMTVNCIHERSGSTSAMRRAAISISPAHESRKAKPRYKGSIAPDAAPWTAARTKSAAFIVGSVPTYRMGRSESCGRLARKSSRVICIRVAALSQRKCEMPVLTAWMAKSAESSAVVHAEGLE
mmetsp:Transcript_10497/g.23398  ORF Transcript_10497/g.23398 Transcript_10497/m.23398 type:complete len:214 (+) Transcript_10497:1015-1656(+)